MTRSKAGEAEGEGWGFGSSLRVLCHSFISPLMGQTVVLILTGHLH